VKAFTRRDLNHRAMSGRSVSAMARCRKSSPKGSPITLSSTTTSAEGSPGSISWRNRRAAKSSGASASAKGA